MDYDMSRQYNTWDKLDFYCWLVENTKEIYLYCNCIFYFEYFYIVRVSIYVFILLFSLFLENLRLSRQNEMAIACLAESPLYPVTVCRCCYFSWLGDPDSCLAVTSSTCLVPEDWDSRRFLTKQTIMFGYLRLEIKYYPPSLSPFLSFKLLKKRTSCSTRRILCFARTVHC